MIRYFLLGGCLVASTSSIVLWSLNAPAEIMTASRNKRPLAERGNAGFNLPLLCIWAVSNQLQLWNSHSELTFWGYPCIPLVNSLLRLIWISGSPALHASMWTRSCWRCSARKTGFHLHLGLGILSSTSPCIFLLTLQKYSSASSTRHSNLHGTIHGRSYGCHAAKIAPPYRHNSLLLGTWVLFLLSTAESCI